MGMMFRQTLKPDEGMLFVFPRDEELDFYMKNTYVPLSIAFIRSDGVIANITHMEPLRWRAPLAHRLPLRAGDAARLVFQQRRRRGRASEGPPRHSGAVGRATLRRFVRTFARFRDDDTYVPRFGWIREGWAWAEVLNRKQDVLDLYFIDAKSGRSRKVLTESAPDAWVNVNDDFRILKSGDRFLWTSWRDGHTHIYLYSFNAQDPAAANAKLDANSRAVTMRCSRSTAWMTHPVRFSLPRTKAIRDRRRYFS